MIYYIACWILGFIAGVLGMIFIMKDVYNTHLIGTLDMSFDNLVDGKINMKIERLPESRAGDFVILKLKAQKNSGAI